VRTLHPAELACRFPAVVKTLPRVYAAPTQPKHQYAWVPLLTSTARAVDDDWQHSPNTGPRLGSDPACTSASYSTTPPPATPYVDPPQRYERSPNPNRRRVASWGLVSGWAGWSGLVVCCCFVSSGRPSPSRPLPITSEPEPCLSRRPKEL
jgi:hypothetical protein